MGKLETAAHPGYTPDRRQLASCRADPGEKIIPGYKFVSPDKHNLCEALAIEIVRNIVGGTEDSLTRDYRRTKQEKAVVAHRPEHGRRTRPSISATRA